MKRDKFQNIKRRIVGKLLTFQRHRLTRRVLVLDVIKYVKPQFNETIKGYYLTTPFLLLKVMNVNTGKPYELEVTNQHRFGFYHVNRLF